MMAKIRTYAEFYEKTFKNLKTDQDTIKDFSSHCPQGPILELGGGSGRTLGFITDRPHILLESDPAMISLLYNKSDAFPGSKVLEGSCPTIPAPDNSFAGIFAAFGTIGEINPICVILQEIYRALIPGGFALLLSPVNPEAFHSQPLGIYRSRQSLCKDFSFVYDTLPVACLGRGEYQTHVSLREPGAEQHYIIKQYFPTLQQWMTLFKESDLALLTDPESLKGNRVFNFLLQKPANSAQPLPSPVEEIYNRVAPNYDQFISKAEYGLPSWIGPKFEALTGLYPRVLDLACGNGIVGRLLSEYGVIPSTLLSYDISKEMLKQCKKVGAYTGLCKFDLAHGLPGISALNVDLITAFGLMEFIRNVEPLLSDIRRTLTIGGELLCAFEATEEGIHSDEIKTDVSGSFFYRYRRSNQNVCDLLRSSGFSDVSVDQRTGYISPTTGKSISYLFVHAKRTAL